MKKNQAIVVVVLLCFLSGCSYRSWFYIYNLTNNPVTIQYVLKFTSTNRSDVFISDPEIYSIKGTGNKDTLTKKSDGAVEFNADKKMVTAKLNGKEALELGTWNNFSLADPGLRKKACLNVERFLIIQNETDTLLCDGALLHLMLPGTELDTHVYGIKIE